ncbi:MAG: hypothetical protein KatS3mg035_1189 [Bacteroidia bacterium]|nr:MAG: hypothetical protein KatS3mg035_1189 [Bacteroidia bacterium]
MKKIAFLIYCFFVIFHHNLLAQQFQEFDIEPNGMSNPHDFFVLNDKLVFWAYTDAYGEELWVFDNVSQNVSLLKDIFVGFQGSYIGYPEHIIYNNRLYFTANDSVHGAELWVTDGTTSGTFMLKDINTGEEPSNPGQFFIYNNTLFFSASTANEGTELWKTDGTAAGTVLLKDIFTGPNGSYPTSFVICNGSLFFSAYDSIHGSELWKTNGTTAGTVLVKDLTSDSTDGFPYYPMTPICLNNQLIFVGQTAQYGMEIFISDGTDTGTQLLKDIYPGTDGCSPFYAQKLGNQIIFSADNGTNGQELWKTDGTTAGTTLLKDIFPGNQGSYPHDLLVADSIIVFAAENSNNNVELWKTNGSETVLLKDIKTLGGSYPEKFFIFQNQLFFTAEDNTNGKELWVSNGTTNGTQLFKNINTNVGTGSFPNSFTIHNNKLFFIADIGAVNSENYQLFQSDGTPSGTVLIQPVVFQDPFNLFFYPFYFTSTPFGLFFKAQYDYQKGYELWRYYDPNTSITHPYLTHPSLHCYPNPFAHSVKCNCNKGEVLEIYSLDGKLLKTQKIDYDFQSFELDYSVPVLVKGKNGYQILMPEK